MGNRAQLLCLLFLLPHIIATSFASFPHIVAVSGSHRGVSLVLQCWQITLYGKHCQKGSRQASRMHDDWIACSMDSLCSLRGALSQNKWSARSCIAIQGGREPISSCTDRSNAVAKCVLFPATTLG